MRLVLDASTAILLTKAGLLATVSRNIECWMGDVAYEEVLQKRTDDAVAIESLVRRGKIRCESGGSYEQLVTDFRLHAGEAESLVLSRAKNAVCGTDDGRAIRCCKVLGIPFTTALGLLVAFTVKGVVPAEQASEMLSRLERFGRYHARIVEDAALRIDGARGAGGGEER